MVYAIDDCVSYRCNMTLFILMITNEGNSLTIEKNYLQNIGIKIPYNKRVEQDLRNDLSVTP